jgi:hypothetical protein
MMGLRSKECALNIESNMMLNMSTIIRLHASTVFCYGLPLILTGVFHGESASVRVANYVLSYIACVHIGYISSMLICKKIQVIHPLLCFYRPHLERTLGGILCILFNVIYFYTAFIHGVDRDDDNDGNNSALPYRGDMLASTLLVTAYVTALEGAYVGLCILFFFKHHQDRFDKIISAERAITFHGTFKEVMEVIDGLEYQCLKYFVRHWKHKSDDEILDGLEDKKHAVFAAFKECVDEDKNDVITYDEFVLFAHKHNVFDTEALWNILTHHRVVTKCIDADLVDYMLYHTLFQKKQFALAIHTDILLARWIITYIGMFSLPLLGIVLSSIWGYASAFDGNLNLFQVYILAASFGMNRLASNVRFASYMAVVRPFNMGELLFIDGDVYKVTKLCPTFVTGEGRDTIVLRNSQMLDSIVRNFSRSNVNDVFVLELPLNTNDMLVGVVRDKMLTYANENWKEIDVGSIRCGWVGMRNQSKVLQCNWRYNFMIYDRNRYNTVRTRFVNDVIRTTVDDVSRLIILMNAAQGGALNPAVVEHYASVSSA